MSESSELLKQELAKSALKYKEDLKTGLDSVSKSIGQSGTTALIVTGSLLGGYLLYRLVSSDEPTETKKRKKGSEEYVEIREVQAQAPSVFEKMTAKIMEEALIFLLNLAKEKLIEYLETKNAEPGDTTTTEGK